MKKRGQIESKLIITILGIILAVVILIIGARTFGGISETQRDIILNKFAQDISNNLELMSVPGQEGSIISAKFTIPKGTKEMCMIDLDKRENILRSGLIDPYPLVVDALDTGSEDNVFLLDAQGGILRSLNVDDLCFQRFPFFLCTQTPQESLNILIKGRGDCAEILFNWSVIKVNNTKDPAKYSQNPIFLNKDTRHIDENNERDILKMVPLSLWRDADDNIESHKYLVVYIGTGQFDNTFILSMMNQNNANDAYLFSSESKQESLSQTQVLNKITDDDIPSFWSQLFDVVVIDTDNKDGALIASLFASHLNAPLLFVDDDNLINYEKLMAGKRVFVVDAIEPGVELFLTGDYDNPAQAAEVQRFTAGTLREGYNDTVIFNSFLLLGSNITVTS